MLLAVKTDFSCLVQREQNVSKNESISRVLYILNSMSHLLKLIEQKQPVDRPAKRSAIEDVLVSLSHALGSSLHEIWTLSTTKSTEERNNIEVEFRIGMIVLEDSRWKPQATEKLALKVDESTRARHGLKFVSGIDECHARSVREYMASSLFQAEEQVLNYLSSFIFASA